MDREKVIKGLQNLRDAIATDFIHEADQAVGTIDNALALLKEQDAVEPILIREGRNKYCNDYVCRICDQELTYGQNYCSECGQAVKWNPDCEDCKPEDIRECTICRQR